ncbi:MAG: hypothetical protein QOI21_5171 [Actinomycetota bacterium]|nr:hypothetical protein [Actinomycetota bacterium]
MVGTKLLYLVRHGESGGDTECSELTETGRHQAALLGERLRGVPSTGIHHSPLARAAQTAAIVGARRGNSKKGRRRQRQPSNISPDQATSISTNW